MTLARSVPLRAALLIVALLFAGVAGAANAAKPAGAEGPGTQIFPGTSSKEPVSIDADKLVYYDKERKAVYTGNVVVIQGDTKLTCSAMTVFLDRSPEQGPAEAGGGAENGPASNSGIKHLEASGPVTVVSKTQVATGDNGSYDKAQSKVFLIGHVTLSDGPNVTKGDKLTYDLKSGQATIDTNAKSSRVHGQFTPASSADQTKAK
jgi:lipopolysaccharide export system protein LptA